MSKIAFMFPGQGAQKAGMGKDFYEQSETARKVIERYALKKMISWTRRSIHRQRL